MIDGVAVAPEDASISAFDIGFQRGYGCFEAMRAYGGDIFRFDEHLARLGRSAAMLRIPLRAPEEIAAWCQRVAAGDCIVRVLVSGGIDPGNIGTESVTIVLAQPVPPLPAALGLQSRIAPWHSDGTVFELTGVKALSYGYNLAATIAARADGYEDAILVGESGFVLEGPTFSVAWVAHDALFTPGLELGILQSITRRAAIEAAEQVGIEVVEGCAPLTHLLAADEVLAMSTTKEVAPVVRVDDRTFGVGPVTDRLANAFRSLVVAELGP